MARLLRRVLAVALLASAFYARADALRLEAPAAGATLRGGSLAEVRWSADRLPPAVEEWEAFLSLDGGKYYPFRVTPHLDIELQSFTFVVPNVDTRDARILLRAGNEIDEAHLESRSTFSIVRDPHAEPLAPPALHFEEGEAARDGDAPVQFWTEGARNGSGLTQQASMPVSGIALTARAAATPDGPGAVELSAGAAATPSLDRTLLPARTTRPARVEPVALALDLLLVCRRRNI